MSDLRSLTINVVECAREFTDNVHEETRTDLQGESTCTWCDAPWPCPTQRLTEAIAKYDAAMGGEVGVAL